MNIVILTTVGRKDLECIHVYVYEILRFISFRSG